MAADMSDQVDVIQKVQTLGQVRLRHVETNEILLVPTPSNDVNDPLNWSKGFRYYIACLVCFAMIMSNFLAAGPSIAIVDLVIDFFHAPPTTPGFYAGLNKVAYLFTATALLQGMGNLIWMPLLVKFGRRPVYLFTTALYFACSLWAGYAKTYSGHLAARIVLGFAAGSGETLAPVTIAELFFLHERGLVMALYTVSLAAGVSLGTILSGLITIHNSWRVIYYVAAGLIGFQFLLIFFTMPETAYQRTLTNSSASSDPDALDMDKKAMQVKSNHVEGGESRQLQGHKKTYLQNLTVYNGILTKESVLQIFIRPVLLLALPPVLWATLVLAVSIGFYVAISTNVATAFQATYHFAAWQTGLCFVSALVGCLIGIPAGGWLSDYVANFLTKRNNGIREPEHRLPAMVISVVLQPIGLVLYGVGIEKSLHWMVPTFALGLQSFTIAAATNVSLVYVIDAYRPIAGECVVTQHAFKAAFGFLLSFYTNPWIQKSGYIDAFGGMAGISAAVLLGFIPLYIWGQRIRHATIDWRIFKLVNWNVDREVGE